MPPTAQELELAVLYASGTAGSTGSDGAELKEQATRFCNEVKASADGWVPALQVFGSTASEQARFFALSVLQEALGARPGAPCRLTNVDDRGRIRETLMAWLNDSSLKLAELEPYLLTKVAVVLGLLLRADYPERWPGAFAQLTALLGHGPKYIELYFRFLSAIDEDIVNFNVHRSPPEVERNTQVKDAMRRAGVLSDVCSIVHTTVVTYRTEREGLAAFALSTLCKFVGWIDIGLVVNDRILPLLYQCLGQAANSPDLAQAAAECLEQVVTKGIADTSEKLRVLQSLNLIEVLQQLPPASLDEDVAAKLSELVNSFADQLLILWEKVGPSSTATDNSSTSSSTEAGQTAAMLSAVVPLLWQYLSHSDVTVSQSVIPAVTRLVQVLKREQVNAAAAASAAAGACGSEAGLSASSSGKSLFSAVAHAPQLLTVVYARMQYPSDFQFDANDEDDGEEDALRSALRKVFVNTCRACPDLVLQFLCSALQALPSPLSSLPWPAAEAALRLLYHFSEGCSGGVGSPKGGTLGASHLLHEGTFPQMVLALHRSDISQHSHPHVLMLYYDITVRYVKILKSQRELIPVIMEALCGQRGLAHPHRLLRARACYDLSKLVKALGTEMVGYVDGVVPGVAELLQAGATRGDLSEDSVLNLYETLGCLIGMQGVPPDRRAVYLEGVLRPLLNRVQGLLSQSGAIAADPDAAGEALAFCLAGLANVSKGFSKPVPELTALHSQELEAAAASILALPEHTAVRAKAVFLMHRMVPLLGEGMLQQVGSAALALITHCKGGDMEEVVTLMNQFTLAFNAGAAPLIDAVLLPLIRTIYELLPPLAAAGSAAAAASNGEATAGERRNSSEAGSSSRAAAVATGPLSHEVVERTALLKQYFSFLSHVINNGLLGVLASPTNAQQMDAILQSVVEGLVDLEDPLAKKACAGVLAALVKELADQTPAVAALPAGLAAAMGTFAAEHATPAVLRVLLAPSFNLKDANSIGAMNVMGALLHSIRRLRAGSLDFLVASLQQVTRQVQLQVDAPYVEAQASQLVAVVAAAEDGATVGKAIRGFAAQVRKTR